MKSILRCLSCLAFVAILGAPAQGEEQRYAEMPAELFLPETNPNRETVAETARLEREFVEPTRIMSHGREVRVVGVAFMPDLEDSIDFTAASETTWWSTLVGESFAGWLNAAEETNAKAAADAGESRRYAGLEAATHLALE